METSDSEYFESADEDLESDIDEEEKLHSSRTVKSECQQETKVDKQQAIAPEGVEKIALESSLPIQQSKIQQREVVNETGDAKCITDNSPNDLHQEGKTAPKPKSKMCIKLTGAEETTKRERMEHADCYSEPVQGKKEDTIETLCSNLKLTDSPSIGETEKDEDNMWEGEENWEPVETTQDPRAIEENMWEDDKWEPIDNAANIKTVPENTWSSWGSWSSSILSTASTLTNHVSHGLTTVLESSIGVPDPEQLAKLHKSAEKEPDVQVKPIQVEQKPALAFGLGNLVSGVSQITKIVENTGSKVITGSLDTLEAIGKKTMEVLQDGDPGLKKSRAFLQIENDKHMLSRVLREAKERAEAENRLLQEKHKARKANFETLFDDHQGLVHLEALEMLSKQCDIKLQTLIELQQGQALTEMQETMAQVHELCELSDDDESTTTTTTFVEAEVQGKLEAAVSEMNVAISYEKLIATWNESRDWLQQLNEKVCDERELYERAIDTLAQLTSLAVEQFHKAGELLLLKEHHSTADEADSLVQLTSTLISLVSNVAGKFADKLHQLTPHTSNKDELNHLITNVYYESANSSTYIKDAFKLLIPVLQHGVV